MPSSLFWPNSDLDGKKQSLPQFENRFNKSITIHMFSSMKSNLLKILKGCQGDDIRKSGVWLDSCGALELPKWIDVKKADKAREKMEKDNIIYGGSLSYRHMCRFNSGFFFRHPLLKTYDYYWRVEPGVDFTCDINYDPFLFMEDNGKDYGFTIMLPEYEATIPTLWDTTKKFHEEISSVYASSQCDERNV